MLPKHSTNPAITPAPVSGFVKGGSQVKAFLRFVTECPDFGFAHTNHPISFTHQSTASPSSLLQEIVAVPSTPERAKESKMRAVLRGFAVIFHLLPWAMESESIKSFSGCAGSDMGSVHFCCSLFGHKHKRLSPMSSDGSVTTFQCDSGGLCVQLLTSLQSHRKVWREKGIYPANLYS